MNRKHLDDKLDNWLDGALAEYGKNEPRPGMESRVLAGLSSRLKCCPWWARRWRPFWMPAAVVAAFFCVVILFLTPQKPPPPAVSTGNDQELLRGVDRLLNQEVPSALAPALVLTNEIVRKP